ncbi:hypothetical protein T439DRAFT_323111 [Meredithblackwellia eburnea MCA 4105]
MLPGGSSTTQPPASQRTGRLLRNHQGLPMPAPPRLVPPPAPVAPQFPLPIPIGTRGPPAPAPAIGPPYGVGPPPSLFDPSLLINGHNPVSSPPGRFRTLSRSPSPQSPKSRSSSQERSSKSKQFLQTAQSFLEQPNPNDIQIVFPRTSSEIWANSKVLAKASPYFQDLTESGFSETVKGEESNKTEEPTTPEADPASESDKKKGKKRARSEEWEPLPFDDSDDEWEFENPPKPCLESPGVTPRYKITVTEAAHSTYLAVLMWIYTGEIRFRALSSIPKPSMPASEQDALPIMEVSFKSVYRLADFLALPELKQLALKTFERNLNPSNAAAELYGPLSRTFPEVQEVALRYTEKHWDKVRLSEGMKKIDELLDLGDGEEAAEMGLTSHRLAKRLRGRDSK